MRRWISFLLLLAIVLGVAAGCIQQVPSTATTQPQTPTTSTPDQDEAVIKKVLLINNKDIEIYFTGNQAFEADGDLERFVVKNSKGEVLALSEHYGGTGTVRTDKILTIQLQEPVSTDAALTLTYLPTEHTYTIEYDSYYKYEIQAQCGITICGSRAIIWGEKTMQRAAEMVDTMASQMPELIQEMLENDVLLAIYGRNEYAVYIPELRGATSDSNRFTAGLGGQFCSTPEANIWQWQYDDPQLPVIGYFTRHVGENLLVHEFAHGIKSVGFDRLDDQSLAAEWQMIYRHAKAAGLWPKSYAITNPDEFFAVLSTIWFNALNESSLDDHWDGTRGPINTRQELYNYDRAAYHFLARLYPATNMGQDWDNIEDVVTVTDMGKDPIPEVYEEESLNYPKMEKGMSFGKTLKITLAGDKYILRTTGKNASLALGYNTFINYPDAAANGLYTIELLSQEDNAYRVYIKNKQNGYLYADGDQIGSCADGSRKTEFTILLDADGYATIGCEEGYWQLPEALPGKNVLLGAEPAKWELSEPIEMKKLLFVHDCTADGSASGLYADAGQVITLKANVPEGKVFKGWKCSNGSVSDPENETTTYTMPDGDAVVWAIYE